MEQCVSEARDGEGGILLTKEGRLGEAWALFIRVERLEAKAKKLMRIQGADNEGIKKALEALKLEKIELLKKRVDHNEKSLIETLLNEGYLQADGFGFYLSQKGFKELVERRLKKLPGDLADKTTLTYMTDYKSVTNEKEPMDRIVISEDNIQTINQLIESSKEKNGGKVNVVFGLEGAHWSTLIITDGKVNYFDTACGRYFSEFVRRCVDEGQQEKLGLMATNVVQSGGSECGFIVAAFISGIFKLATKMRDAGSSDVSKQLFEYFDCFRIGDQPISINNFPSTGIGDFQMILGDNLVSVNNEEVPTFADRFNVCQEQKQRVERHGGRYRVTNFDTLIPVELLKFVQSVRGSKRIIGALERVNDDTKEVDGIELELRNRGDKNKNFKKSISSTQSKLLRYMELYKVAMDDGKEINLRTAVEMQKALHKLLALSSDIEKVLPRQETKKQTISEVLQEYRATLDEISKTLSPTTQEADIS